MHAIKNSHTYTLFELYCSFFPMHFTFTTRKINITVLYADYMVISVCIEEKPHLVMFTPIKYWIYIVNFKLVERKNCRFCTNCSSHDYRINGITTTSITTSITDNDWRLISNCTQNRNSGKWWLWENTERWTTINESLFI